MTKPADFEQKHPRDKNGRWKDKGVAWMQDSQMSQKALIGSSAGSAAATLFLLLDTFLKFLIAILSVATVSVLSWGASRQVKKRRRRKGSTTGIMDGFRQRFGTIRTTSRAWDKRNEPEVIKAKAEAKVLIRGDRRAARAVRKGNRQQARKRAYAKVGKATTVAGSKTRRGAAKVITAVRPNPPAAPSTGSTNGGVKLHGRPVTLLEVDEAGGRANVIDKGKRVWVDSDKLDVST